VKGIAISKLPSPGVVGLAADGSDELLALLEEEQVGVDYVKVGTYMGFDRMLKLAAAYPVLLHCNDAVLTRHFDAQRLAFLAQQTHTPWLSLHLALAGRSIYSVWNRLGIPLALVSREQAFRWAVENLNHLKKLVDMPVAVENLPRHLPSGHAYTVDPAFIRAVLAKTDAYLLLDLGHARVVAAMRGESDQDYVAAMPLERVIEIHISGPGMHRGRLRDLHQPLADVDYALLAKTLPCCPNIRAVTLEYYGPAKVLAGQLARLGQIVNAHT
jgi:hypothetical protein